MYNALLNNKIAQNKAILKIIWKNKKQNNNGNTRQQRQTNHKCSQHKQNLPTARHRRKRNKHIHIYRSNTNSNIINLQPIQKKQRQYKFDINRGGRQLKGEV